MADSGATIATAYVQLVPTLSGVQGSMGKALSDSGVDQEAEKAGKKTGAKWGGAVTAAAGVAVAAGAAAGAALAGLYKVGATFDDVADTIQTTTGKTGAELDGLTEIAKRIGTTVPVEFEKIAPALSNVSQRLGLTGSDLETVTSQFLALGEITGKELNMDQATASFSAFGIKGADVATQMDNLFKVSQATGTGIDDITGLIQKSAPALQQMGFGFQESAALVGQLDKAGLNTQSVLGGMGKALVSLAKDGEEPQAAFARVSSEIGTLVAAGDDAKAIDLASSLFGTKGATQFVEATKNGTLNVDAMTQAMADNQTTILGTAEDTADFAEQWVLLKNKALVALEPLGTAVFGLAGTIGGKLNDAFAAIVPSLEAIGKLMGSGDFQGGIFGLEEDSPIIGGLFALRDAAISVGGAVGGGLQEAFQEIWPVLKEVGGTLGGALVDVFKTLWPEVQKLFPIVRDLLPVLNPIQFLFKALLPILPQIAQVLGDLARVVANVLASALQAVAPLFQKIVDVINRLLPFVTQLVASLLPPLMSLFEALAPLLDSVLAALLPVVDTIIALLIPAIDALMPIVETVFGFVASTIGNALTIFHGLIDFLTGIFTGDWELVWTGVKEIFGGIWDQIKNIFNTLWTLIGQFFTDLAPAIWAIVSGFAGKLAEWGGQFLSWLWDGIKAMGANVFGWFAELPSYLWNALVGFVGAGGSWMADRGSEFIGWLKSGIETGAKAILDWFTDLPNKIWAIIVGIAETVKGWGGAIVSWIVQGVENAASKVVDAIAGLFGGISFNDNGELSAANGYIAAVGMGAGGGVLPGYAPGVDDQLTLLSRGEGVLVPEAVRMLGSDWVYSMNRYARAGRRVSPGAILGYAAGGIAGHMTQLGSDITGYAAGKITKGDKDGLASALGQYAFQSLIKSALGGGLSFNGMINVDGIVAPLPEGARGEFVKAVASQMGTPYVWGGAIPPGFDCSGLMSWALNQAGVGKGRQTADGFDQSQPHVAVAKAGDMVTFDTGRLGSGVAAHIGAVLDPSRSLMMHTDGAGPARVSDYASRDGGPLSILDAIGGSISVGTMVGAGASLMAAMSKQAGLNNQVGPSGEVGMPVSDQGSGVERWRGTVLQALALIGQPASLADTVLNQIRTESSGNPNAINLTDSNARKGTPSKGLIQAIDPTFQAYRLPGLANNVYDPLSNIVAGIRYAIDRYGSIQAGMRGVAYDNGGWLMPSTRPMNLLNQPEPVLTPAQWRIAETAIAQASKTGNEYNWTVYQMPTQSPGELAREMNRLIAFEGSLA